jgi:uncharacterized protein (DUF1778 family)
MTSGQRDSAAATAAGETLSDFFRRAASARAHEVLTDQQQIALNEDQAARSDWYEDWYEEQNDGLDRA